MNIGVTGHQKLEDYDIEWLKDELSQLLADMQIDKGFTSLAAGADQLFAEVLLAHALPFTAIIPCAQYASTFSKEALRVRYEYLLAQAEAVHYMPFITPSEQAFLAAGKKVVELSDYLIAIWDGKKAKGLGGTGDIVNEALLHAKLIYHIHPALKRVMVLKK